MTEIYKKDNLKEARFGMLSNPGGVDVPIPEDQIEMTMAREGFTFLRWVDNDGNTLPGTWPEVVLKREVIGPGVGGKRQMVDIDQDTIDHTPVIESPEVTPLNTTMTGKKVPAGSDLITEPIEYNGPMVKIELTNRIENLDEHQLPTGTFFEIGEIHELPTYVAELLVAEGKAKYVIAENEIVNKETQETVTSTEALTKKNRLGMKQQRTGGKKK